jgi:sugar (pentulose or hexulose) kinase
MPQHDLVLGLDVGTTNLKCLALDDTGTIVAQTSEPTPQSHPRPDWTDFEPEPIWEAICREISALPSPLETSSPSRSITPPRLAETLMPMYVSARLGHCLV